MRQKVKAIKFSPFSFCVTQKIIAFFFGGYKNTPYFCNCQNQCSNTQTKGAMNIKPRTY